MNILEILGCVLILLILVLAYFWTIGRIGLARYRVDKEGNVFDSQGNHIGKRE